MSTDRRLDLLGVAIFLIVASLLVGLIVLEGVRLLDALRTLFTL